MQFFISKVADVQKLVINLFASKGYLSFKYYFESPHQMDSFNYHIELSSTIHFLYF
jgi:hypothetical protein